MKKKYIIFSAEFVLIAVFVYASDKLDRRAVMFDASKRQLYELLSCHALTAAITLPLYFVSAIFIRKISKFATSSVRTRAVMLSVAAVAIYCSVYFILNSSEWPTR